MNPIAKKLLIKPNQRWLFYNEPEGYIIQLSPLPDGVKNEVDLDGEFDGIQLFSINKVALKQDLELIVPFLRPDTVFWITYPKKTSGIKSDLEMMGNWDEPAKYGLRVVTSVSVNETWTALRFKREGTTKISESRNDQIKTNEYADYIDVDKKIITLPPDVLQLLGKSAKAMNFYQSLSYSNRKEYVIWILSAKQEKTKLERLEKLVEKLEAGKKNPSEK